MNVIIFNHPASCTGAQPLGLGLQARGVYLFFQPDTHALRANQMSWQGDSDGRKLPRRKLRIAMLSPALLALYTTTQLQLLLTLDAKRLYAALQALAIKVAKT